MAGPSRRRHGRCADLRSGPTGEDHVIGLAEAETRTDPDGPVHEHADKPTAVVADFVGATLSEYDRLLGVLELDLEGGGGGLRGCLFHWVRATPDGIRVTEVWRQRELFNACLRDEILPTLSAVGLAAPELTFYEVHNSLVEGER